MRAKDYLLQLKRLDTLINNKLVEVEYWKEVAQGTSIANDGDKVSGSSGNQHQMENAVCKYIQMEQEINDSIDRLVQIRQEVITAIEKLPTTEYDVLHKLYVQGREFYEVAEEYGKSYSWSTMIHGRALKHLQRILDGDGHEE